MFLLLCLYMQQTYFLMKNRIVLFIAGCCARFAVIINGEHLFEVVAEIFKLVAELVVARVV